MERLGPTGPRLRAPKPQKPIGSTERALKVIGSLALLGLCVFVLLTTLVEGKVPMLGRNAGDVSLQESPFIFLFALVVWFAITGVILADLIRVLRAPRKEI